MSDADHCDIPADPVANLAKIRDALDKAMAHNNGVSPPITITAVSKKHGPDRILPLLEAGHRDFGENRVQEALGKWPALKARYGDVELRLIGPLQSNKVRDAVGLFDVIETVDRPKIARLLAEEMRLQNRRVALLVQVNTGEEPQKAGMAPGDVDAFINLCKDQYGLTIDGLMCIPPADQAPAPHFALLAKIAARNGLETLSMGMSADYETAVQLGATHIRVGTQLFGARPDSP